MNRLPNALLAGLLSTAFTLAACGPSVADQDLAKSKERVIPETCGDGIIQEGEFCDDAEGNSDAKIGACRLDCAYLACEGTTYEALSLEGSAFCAEDVVYTGNVRIEKSNDLEDLSGFTRVMGNLVIAGNVYSSVNMDTLRRIDGNLWIWDSGHLVDFEMPKLEEVGGDILIRNNNSLRDFGMSSLLRFER